MSEKWALYIEYPDRELTIMVKDDGEGPYVWTFDGAGEMDYWVNVLKKDGYNVASVLRSESVDGEDGKRRDWERIDPDSVPYIRLYSTEELDTMTAKTHARFPEHFAKDA